MNQNLTSNNLMVEDAWKFDGELDYVNQWFLMKTPIPLIIISAAYLSFVIKVGPKLMKNRPPMSINNVLVAYNSLQVIYSIYMCWVGSTLILQNGLLGKTCMMDTKESRYVITTSTYIYFFAKVTELLDTIFFVLRKKDNQVTFLHVYHHMCTMWCTWIILKYEPTYSVIFLGTLNSYVHVVMYAYYALSAIPGLAKTLWWKKYITSLQLIQFVVIILQAAGSALFPGCPPSYTAMVMIYVNASLFIYLFGKFYINSYSNPKKTKSKIELNHSQNFVNKVK